MIFDEFFKLFIINFVDYISILEFDDEYSTIWFKNVKRFIEAYPEVDAFLPLVVDTDDKGVFAGFTNEATFAVSLNSEMGVLTNDVLLTYQNFQSSGMVIKKSTYEDNGGFKPSVKLTAFELPIKINNKKNAYNQPKSSLMFSVWILIIGSFPPCINKIKKIIAINNCPINF